MAETSSNLALPFLIASQADKHVSVNDAFERLDAVVQLTVKSCTMTQEPTTPTEGESYIIPAGATGTHWTQIQAGTVVSWRSGGWIIVRPNKGWQAFILDASETKLWNGTQWSQMSARNALGAVGETDDNNFSGLTTFSGGIVLASSAPNIFFNDIDALQNQKKVTLDVAGGEYSIFYVDDNFANFNLAFSIARSGAHPVAVNVGATVRPTADGSYALGTATKRFSALFLTTGTIQTSDADDKSELAEPPAALVRVGRRLMKKIGVFQWKDALAAKGNDQARLHLGLTAQAVRDAFLAEKLDPDRWGMFCRDKTDEDQADSHPRGERLGLRFDQVLTLLLLTSNTQRASR